MTVLLVKPKKFNLISWIIMKIEKTQGSHLCFHWWSEYFKRNLYFTTELLSGASIENSEHMNKYKVVYCWNLNLTKEEDIKLKQNFFDALHVRYGFLKLISILFKRLFKINLKIQDKDKFQICSENIVRMIDYNNELKSYSNIGLREAIKLLDQKINKET
jgi:hypothetical protein